MAILRFPQIVSTGAAFNVNFGFVPSYLRVVNQTKLAAGAGVAVSEWQSSMLNGFALIQTLTAGAPVYTQLATNGFTPFVTSDAALWTPTNKTVTGITQAAQANVTLTTHGFTAQDIGITVLSFHNVVGMNAINTLQGVIVSIPGVNNVVVNINTTSFSAYTSGGIANVITGMPAGSVYIGQTAYAIGAQPFFANSSGQYLNTAQQNLGQMGVTFGSGVAGSLSDVLLVQAYLDAPFTS